MIYIRNYHAAEFTVPRWNSTQRFELDMSVRSEGGTYLGSRYPASSPSVGATA